MKMIDVAIDIDTGEVFKEVEYQNAFPLPNDGFLCRIDEMEMSLEVKDDIRYIYSLIPFIQRGSNVIYGKEKAGNRTPVKNTDIAKIWKLDDWSTNIVLRRLISSGILNTTPLKVNGISQMCFVFNPYYVNTMTYIPLNIYKLFKPYMKYLFDVETMKTIESYF